MFVVQHLLGHMPRMRNPRRGDGVCFMHIYPERIPELLTLTDYPWIVPLRHPDKVWGSWKARRKDLDHLEALWETLEVLDCHSPLYLPIDSPRRDAALKGLERVVGPLHTDWPVIASSGLKAEAKAPSRAVEFYETCCARSLDQGVTNTESTEPL